MTTEEHVNPIRIIGPSAASDSQARRIAALRRIAATPWECDYCHQTFMLNGKGRHLSCCKLNPNRPRTVRKGSKRNDLIPCRYCTKGISPQAMRYHEDVYCRVAAALREGRVVTAEQADRGLTALREPWAGPIERDDPEQTTYRVEQAAKFRPEQPFDHQLAEDVLADAVEQIMGMRYDDLPRATQFGVFRRIVDLVDLLEAAV